MAKFIYVMPTDKAGDRVVLFERHADHPGGEAFVRGYSDADKRKAKRVAHTGAVRDAIHAGLLIETTKAGKPKNAPAESEGDAS